MKTIKCYSLMYFSHTFYVLFIFQSLAIFAANTTTKEIFTAENTYPINPKVWPLTPLF